MHNNCNSKIQHVQQQHFFFCTISARWYRAKLTNTCEKLEITKAGIVWSTKYCFIRYLTNRAENGALLKHSTCEKKGLHVTLVRKYKTNFVHVIIFKYSPVRNRRPPDYLSVQKMHTRPGNFYCNPPPRLLISWAKTTLSIPDPVIQDQTFCQRFAVLKNVCMIKSQFPHHSLSYVRSEWNKLPQETTKDMQFFQPPPRLLQPLRLFTFRFFPTLRLLPPPFYSGLESSTWAF